MKIANIIAKHWLSRRLLFTYVAVTSIVTAFLTYYQAFVELEGLFEPTVVEIELLNTPIHLGDNYRSIIGGDISHVPSPQNCYNGANFSNVYMVCLDKKGERLIATGGAGGYGLSLTNEFIAPELQNMNLEAWEHIFVGPERDMSQRELEGGIFFDQNHIVWRQNAGNYYSRVAPFLVGFQASASEIIDEGGLSSVNGTYKLALKFDALTGGCRTNQKNKFFVFFRNEIKPVEFPTCNGNDARFMSVTFEFSLQPGDRPLLEFGFFVLPWQEKLPKPPNDYLGDQRGPAHFQDVDINWVRGEISSISN